MTSPSTPQDLLARLIGPLAPIRDRLSHGPETRRVVPSAQVLEADVFACLMQSYARRFGIKPDGYLVSLWSQKYLATVIVPVMALSVIGGRAVHADIENLAIVVDDEGEPVALRLPSAFIAEGADQAASLLVSTHLIPLVDAQAMRRRLSRKVFSGQHGTLSRVNSPTVSGEDRRLCPAHPDDRCQRQHRPGRTAASTQDRLSAAAPALGCRNDGPRTRVAGTLSLVRTLSQDNGIGIIIVLHDINMASRFCDTIAALHSGRVIMQGTPEAILTPEALDLIYGLPMDVMIHEATKRPLAIAR